MEDKNQAKKEEQLAKFNASVLLPNYRDFFYKMQEFYFDSHAALFHGDHRALIKIVKELEKDGFYDIAHRAKIEIQDFILLNPNSKKELATMLSVEVGYLFETATRYSRQFKLSHEKNIKYFPFFEIVRKVYWLVEVLESQDLFANKSLPIPKSNQQFTLAQIALLHIYNKMLIRDPRTDPKRKANDIAKEYGFDSPTSGLQLFNKFCDLDGGTAQRTGITNKKVMLANIQGILPELKGEAKSKAQFELNELLSLIQRTNDE